MRESTYRRPANKRISLIRDRTDHPFPLPLMLKDSLVRDSEFEKISISMVETSVILFLCISITTKNIYFG